MNRREVLTTAALVSTGCLGDGADGSGGATTEGATRTGTDAGGVETTTDTDRAPTTETRTETTRARASGAGTETAGTARGTAGTKAGAGSVASREFTVRETDAPVGDEARVSFEDEGRNVVITGTITGKNGCQTAVLDSVQMEGSTLTVTVATKEEAGTDAVCSQALIGITYRLAVTLETPPQSVRVVHRGANGRREVATTERGG